MNCSIIINLGNLEHFLLILTSMKFLQMIVRTENTEIQRPVDTASNAVVSDITNKNFSTKRNKFESENTIVVLASNEIINEGSAEIYMTLNATSKETSGEPYEIPTSITRTITPTENQWEMLEMLIKLMTFLH